MSLTITRCTVVRVLSIVSVCFLLIIPYLGSGQVSTGILKGVIIDGSTLRSLYEVSIGTGNPGDTSILSGADGSYVLPLKKGDHSLVFSKEGFRSKKISEIPIIAGHVTYFRVILLPGDGEAAPKTVNFFDEIKDKTTDQYLYARQVNDVI